jgi:hypothetical protein
MFREVFGKVYKTTDTPWLNATVVFKRAKGSFTSEAQYPPDTARFYTDNQGFLVDFNAQGVAIPCRLWVNETGDKISNYQVTIGLDKFTISIPVGDGSPISLSALRAGSQPTEEYPQSLLEYIDEKTESIVAGESRALYSNTLTAVQNLSALRIINLNTGNYASCLDLTNAFISLGFVNQAVSVGGTLKAVTQGLVSDSSWNWDITKPIFLGDTGQLTQTIINNAVFLKAVALAISPQSIFINFGESIIL